jgi:hypothetical protein
MVIAILALLGVSLIVIVAFIAFVAMRRRWLKHQPGYFVGAVRVSDGQVPGLRSKWKRGSGRWVHDVFVWNNAPLMMVTKVVPCDDLLSEEPSSTEGVKHLGDEPYVVAVSSGGATMQIAAKPENRDLAVGPFTHEDVGLAAARP